MARRLSAIGYQLSVASLVMGLATSCGAGGQRTAPDPRAAAAVLDMDAAEAFEALRQGLLDQRFVRVDFSVEADTGRTADLSGALWLGPQNRAWLRASGTFAGDSVAPGAISDGTRMVYGRDAQTDFSTPVATPPALNNAVVVGFFGMGILHNLAMLTADQPPDHADGGAAAWVTAHDLAWGTPEERGGRTLRPLTFAIQVDAQPSGTAALWLDAETGLPSERTQTVAFPDGTMEVVERYRAWRFARPPVGFVLPPGVPADSTTVVP
ncbi:MAG: hypothetical protein AAF809_11835 [Bacteroidota bacterium]